MALSISISLTAISLGLLVIYAADVAVTQISDTGFLPFDHMIRGLGLGGPSLILPIIAFFISRKQASKTLGAMLIASGVFIVIGGITVLALNDPSAQETARNALSEAAPLLVIGAFITALGAIKLRQS